MWGVPDWAMGVAVIIVAVSCGKALQRMFQQHAGPIAGRGASDSELSRQREALDEVQKRLGDLEERVDFAERLLAKQRRSEEHTSELQSLAYLVCRLLLEKKKKSKNKQY